MGMFVGAVLEYICSSIKETVLVVLRETIGCDAIPCVCHDAHDASLGDSLFLSACLLPIVKESIVQW